MVASAGYCAFDVERGPDWLLVRLRPLGRGFQELRFADSVWGLIEQHFTYRIVLELDAMPRLSRQMIVQLVELHRRIGEHDGVLRLCGLSPQNRQALATCGLGDLLHPYGNRAEAVMGGPHSVRYGF